MAEKSSFYFTIGGGMEEQKSFKRRVLEAVIKNAYSYKKYYVKYEYLLCSRAFMKADYYIVNAFEDNYLHLTGLHTELDASTFFTKCYNGTLTESDFDFCKNGQNEKAVKGSVRRKINSLSTIMDLFIEGTIVEEDFEKNKIKCAFAAGNVCSTLGFVVAGTARPMTLLKGNELKAEKAKELDLVLRRRTGEKHFSEIIIGTTDNLKEHKDTLWDLLSEELCLSMSDSMTE